MKKIGALLFICFVALFNSHSGPLHNAQEKFITPEKIEALKMKTTFDVLDYENHPFKDLTKEEIIHKLGLMRDYTPQKKQIIYGKKNENLPDNFHYKDKWPQCLHQIRDQQLCGSCWAFAASEVLSDRFCISSNANINVVLSPQDLLSCDQQNFGCEGGYVDKSWDYIKDQGIVTEACLPYTSGTGSLGKCPFNIDKGTCKSGQFIKYKVVSHKKYETIEEAKETLFLEGPVEAAFQVYYDFMSYKGGVYRRTSDELLGGQAVKVVGWGTDTDGTEYWIAANSWNTSWGENGFFRIAFGECFFEESLWAGKPYIEALDKFLN